MSYICPTHNIVLIKKSILYGLPDIRASLDNYILGGCVIKSDSPTHGYECPVDAAVYLLNQKGELIRKELDDESGNS